MALPAWALEALRQEQEEERAQQQQQEGAEAGRGGEAAARGEARGAGQGNGRSDYARVLELLHAHGERIACCSCAPLRVGGRAPSSSLPHQLTCVLPVPLPPGADVAGYRAPGGSGLTTLHEAVREGCEPGVVAALLRMGVAPDATTGALAFGGEGLVGMTGGRLCTSCVTLRHLAPRTRPACDPLTARRPRARRRDGAAPGGGHRPPGPGRRAAAAGARLAAVRRRRRGRPHAAHAGGAGGRPRSAERAAGAHHAGRGASALGARELLSGSS